MPPLESVRSQSDPVRRMVPAGMLGTVDKDGNDEFTRQFWSFEYSTDDGDDGAAAT